MFQDGRQQNRHGAEMDVSPQPGIGLEPELAAAAKPGKTVVSIRLWQRGTSERGYGGGVHAESQTRPCQGKARAGCPAIWWKPKEATEATDERSQAPVSLLRLAARACQGPTPHAGFLWGSAMV